MRELLADDGTIYVHCDWKVNSLILIVWLLDEVFGGQQCTFQHPLINQVVWYYYNKMAPNSKCFLFDS